MLGSNIRWSNMTGQSNHLISLLGAPVEQGAGQLGCGMGPAALRIAGIHQSLAALGHDVEDLGDLQPHAVTEQLSGRARNSREVAGWMRILEESAYQTMQRGRLPIFLGGDHSLSMGSVSGVARHARNIGRPQFVLWLDAHSDYNTPATSISGNMHGMSTAFLCGEPGFDGLLDPHRTTVDPARVILFGIRSVDVAERELIAQRGATIFDMRAIDEIGTATIMREVIAMVKAANGMLHVSLDVDLLDPSIAPGVGTTVPGGATYREAHLVMEMLNECGLVTSFDLVELNPYLDDRGKSARLLVELAASLFGRKVIDRPANVLDYEGGGYAGAN